MKCYRFPHYKAFIQSRRTFRLIICYRFQHDRKPSFNPGSLYHLVVFQSEVDALKQILRSFQVEGRRISAGADGWFHACQLSLQKFCIFTVASACLRVLPICIASYSNQDGMGLQRLSEMSLNTNEQNA